MTTIMLIGAVVADLVSTYVGDPPELAIRRMLASAFACELVFRAVRSFCR